MDYVQAVKNALEQKKIMQQNKKMIESQVREKLQLVKPAIHSSLHKLHEEGISTNIRDLATMSDDSIEFEVKIENTTIYIAKRKVENKIREDLDASIEEIIEVMILDNIVDTINV